MYSVFTNTAPQSLALPCTCIQKACCSQLSRRHICSTLLKCNAPSAGCAATQQNLCSTLRDAMQLQTVVSCATDEMLHMSGGQLASSILLARASVTWAGRPAAAGSGPKANARSFALARTTCNKTCRSLSHPGPKMLCLVLLEFQPAIGSSCKQNQACQLCILSLTKLYADIFWFQT